MARRSPGRGAAAISVVAVVILVVLALAIERRGARSTPVVRASPAATDQAGLRPPPRRARASAVRTAPAAAAAPASAPVATVPTRPASLIGTEVDGELVVDADGRFVATASAVRLFDYFLATIGELDLAAIRALVAEEVGRRLADQAPDQVAVVLALFDGYVAHLEDSRRAAATAPVTTTPRDHLDRLGELQRDRFGAAAATRMFGDDLALARVIIDRTELEARDDLSAVEREARLTELERALPPAVRAARVRVRLPAEVRAEVDARRRAGADADEIWALRASRLGAAAADRLARLDAERARRER